MMGLQMQGGFKSWILASWGAFVRDGPDKNIYKFALGALTPKPPRLEKIMGRSEPYGDHFRIAHYIANSQ